ncbi:hypothetical protein O3P69_014425 [Scylla paramamosain]|uniref:Uncharacterized protein n=1 Tax=Scylla paramamosain TaxID=85552 RepID=A0AAW0TBW2_SCYPA
MDVGHADGWPSRAELKMDGLRQQRRHGSRSTGSGAGGPLIRAPARMPGAPAGQRPEKNNSPEVGTVQALQGVSVFQVEGYNLNANASLIQLRSTVDKIRQLGGAWHCLVVVVVSDDPSFLAAFTHLSLRRHALRWSTRILVLTRLPLSHLGGLHGLLSTRNAMLLLAHPDEKAVRSVGVYVSSPYSSPSARPRKVDTWTPNTTWTRATHLFPEKFLVFGSAPTLTIGIELMPQHKLSWEEDPHAPDGRRLVYTGTLDKTVQYFAKGMNFTRRFAKAAGPPTPSALCASSYSKDAESGMFKEVAELEQKGRLEFHTQSQFLESLSTLVRVGHHVLVIGDITIKSLVASMMALLDSGLLRYWAQDVPNFTRCHNIPKRVMLFTTLSTINLWGMFVVWIVGMAGGTMVWCAELLIRPTSQRASS